ncbi:MCE family protein [Rhodococcus opacus]|uniref:MCE family protein n=1 Tax=Rhodococcus TaxID=1827 RepID=UPI00135AC834|nr:MULTISPECIES: MCE family protein [Rhodococcus]MDJ0420093.1 MCE family protein [Rhodococcus opacus]MDV7089066.1 MCE family protein [Rhodococcus opacus]UNN04620.1 MCE family protein [Rhodococcus opacus]WKN52421.1 MCE family protein [Rhodococcus opacus]
MSRTQKTNTVRTGLIGVLVVAALVLISVNFDRIASTLSSSVTYTAYVGDTGGLETGDKVFLSGVHVGDVEDIDLDGDKVRIAFSVDGPRLGVDSEVSIKTLTVLGRKFLQVTPKGDKALSPDQPIPLEHTSTPYLLTDALGDLSTTVSNLDTDQVTNALDTLSQTLDQTAPNLSAALDGVSRLSDTVGTRDQMVKDLFHNAESLTKVLGGRSEQINKLLLDSNTLFTALDQRRQAIDTLLVNLSAVTAQVASLVDDNEAQLRPVLDQLNSVTALLNERKDDVKKAILPASQYITSLGESVASGPFFKAYIMNLLPGQFLQPFIDAAFREQGVNPGTLNGQNQFPVTCGHNAAPGLTPPGHTTPLPDPSTCPVQPGDPAAPAPAAAPAQPGPPALPGLPQLPPLPQLPGLPPLPGLGG